MVKLFINLQKNYEFEKILLMIVGNVEKVKISQNKIMKILYLNEVLKEC